MSNLIPHVFNDISIRTTEINGQIWFVAADVCKALEISNPSKALTSLDEDERLTLTNSEGQNGRGAQSYNIINESGLYSLILRSRKIEAKRFKKWVTAEVLPSIRKTGSYHAPQMTEDQLMHWQWTSEHYSGKIGHDQAEMLHFLMRRWIEQSGLQQQTAYHNFHTHMGVGRTDYIKRQDFKKAMTYLHLKTGQINHGATDFPAASKRQPAPALPDLQAAYLTEREQRALSALIHHFKELNVLVYNLQRPLSQIGYPHSADLFDHRQIANTQCMMLKRFA
mgnify:CR=1 FL=1